MSEMTTGQWVEANLSVIRNEMEAGDELAFRIYNGYQAYLAEGVNSTVYPQLMEAVEEYKERENQPNENA